MAGKQNERTMASAWPRKGFLNKFNIISTIPKPKIPYLALIRYNIFDPIVRLPAAATKLFVE
jgi:hypothetical protein